MQHIIKKTRLVESKSYEICLVCWLPDKHLHAVPIVSRAALASTTVHRQEALQPLPWTRFSASACARWKLYTGSETLSPLMVHAWAVRLYASKCGQRSLPALFVGVSRRRKHVTCNGG